MEPIQCPCCENTSSYDAWYEISNDSFYICPVCKNTCTPDEIELQSNEEQASAIQLLSYEEGEHLIVDDSFDYLSYFFKGNSAYLFVESNQIIGTAYLVFRQEDKSVYIGNIDSVEEGKGYGRKMINYLKSMEEVQQITGESADVAKGFFEKMGAMFGEYDKCMEGYEFTISC